MRIIFAFIITLIGVCIWGIHYFVGQLMPSWPWLRWAVTAFNLVGLGSFLISFFGRETLEVRWLNVLSTAGTAWFIIYLYIFMLVLVLSLVRLVPSIRAYTTDNAWFVVGCITALIGLFVYANRTYHHKERVSLDITLEKPLATPLKIVGLSDMHLGHTIGRDELERWVEMINREQPDLILIAGDIVDGSTRPVLADNMPEVLDKLEARLGVYAVLGNHEYIGDEASEGKVLAQTRIKLLRDEVVLVDNSLYIVGRDDRMNSERKPLGALLEGLDHSKPIILLDHQPYALEEAQRLGVDFQLSGHTHRGQVFPANLLVDRMYEQAHGYLRKGDSHYYVSSGLGIWGGKFRIGTQSEYLCLSLRGATAE